MITAANIIGSSAVIVAAKPMLVDSITGEIPKVEKNKMDKRGMFWRLAIA
jgi:hypothetical protein